MDPIIGALLASGLSAIFGSAQTIFANKYNSPVSQLRRLRKAGLPLSYMYQGRVNQQSDVPKLSIDPTLGVTQKIQLEQQKPVQEAQVSNLQAETAGKVLANKEEKAIQDWKNKQNSIDIDYAGKNKLYGTNRELGLEIELAEANSKRFIQRQEAKLKEIAKNIGVYLEETNKELGKQQLAKIKQQIKNMLSQDKLMGQLHNIRTIEETINKTVGDGLSSMPQWLQAVYFIIFKLAK